MGNFLKGLSNGLKPLGDSFKALFASRRFRQGSAAAAITVAGVALLVVFSMLVSLISDRYSLSLDLTANKIFGISDQTKEYLAALDKDVVIYVLSTEESFTANGEYFTQANEVIKKYSQQSPHVKVQYVDIIRNPNFTSRYPDLQLSSTSILVTCGDKVTDLTPYDLYNIETDPYYGQQKIASSRAEQAMTSALLKVTSDKVTSVTIITGHGESPLSALVSLLELNNYSVTERNLLTEEIDTESKFVIMNAPMRDLTEDELKKLDKFLDNDGKLGKTLFYAAYIGQPDYGSLPALSTFLADWGIEVKDSLVFEASVNRTLNLNMYMPVVDYTEDVYASSVIERNMYTLIPYARPMAVLFESKGGISVTSPLMFSQSSGIVPLDAEEGWQPTSELDLSGPIPALIVSQKQAYEGTAPIRSNVAALASSIALEDSYLSAQSIGNGDYFLSLINTLSEREDVVNIQSKAIGAGELGVQSQHVVGLGLLLVIILPLAVLIFGIATWLRRRHR